MIEAAMYIALGFFLAILLAAAVFPAIYKRAVRLTKEAMMAVNPASYAEVRASQDFERASHALALRRAEAAIEREREKSVSHRLEAGRLTAEMVKLRAAHERETNVLKEALEKAETVAGGRKAKTGALSAELEETRERLRHAEQALAASRAEADLLRQEKYDAEHPAAQDDTVALTTITSLESQIATLKAQVSQLEKDGNAPVTDPLLWAEADELRAIVGKLESELVDAETKYISALAEITRLSVAVDEKPGSKDEELEKLQRELKWADDEKARLTALVHDRERTLERARAQVADLRSRLLLPDEADAQTAAPSGKPDTPAATPLGDASFLVNRIIRSSRSSDDDTSMIEVKDAASTNGNVAAEPEAGDKSESTKRAKESSEPKKLRTSRVKKRDVA